MIELVCVALGFFALVVGFIGGRKIGRDAAASGIRSALEIRDRQGQAMEAMGEALDREHGWTQEAIEAAKKAGFTPSWERER